MIIKEKFSLMRSYKFGCLILILFLLLIYTFENSPVTAYLDSRLLNYVLKPLLWLGLAYIAWLFPKARPKGKLTLQNRMIWWSVIIGFIYIIILVIAGLVDGLGKSPYSHSPVGIITNLIYVCSMLIAREFVRNYLINKLTKKENYIVLIIVAFFMAGTSIPFNHYMNLNDNRESIKFIAEYFAPEFTHNLLANYLVFLGGPLLSIIYLGIIQGFYWLSPVLPDLQWITKALIGILYPIFSLMTIQSLYLETSKGEKKRDRGNDSPISWMITSILSIAIIWFAVGVFPIYPSVIATGSMEPMIKPGDVIIVQKIDGKNVELGDVIQFKRDNILISHRVIEIIEEDNTKNYRTKGDNNSSADVELVEIHQVKGKVEYVVPKIGWLTLLIKSEDDIPIDVEF